MNTLKLFVSILAMGASCAFGATYQTTKIDQIYAGYSDGSIFIQVTDPAENPAGCTTSATNTYGADPASNDVKSLLALFLAAKATDSSVRIRVDETSCKGMYPKIMIAILQ